MSAAQWHENNNEACRSDATPAQVTEAHRELARRIMFEFTQAGTATASDVRMAAQLIADSEAKAVAEWQDFVHLKGEAIDSLLMECNRLRAENSDLRTKSCQCAYDEACAHVLRAEANEALIKLARLHGVAKYVSGWRQRLDKTGPDITAGGGGYIPEAVIEELETLLLPNIRHQPVGGKASTKSKSNERKP